MKLSIKVDPLLRKKNAPEHMIELCVDQDELLLENGTSMITGITNEMVPINYLVKTKDLYNWALLIVNHMEDEDASSAKNK